MKYGFIDPDLSFNIQICLKLEKDDDLLQKKQKMLRELNFKNTSEIIEKTDNLLEILSFARLITIDQQELDEFEPPESDDSLPESFKEGFSDQLPQTMTNEHKSWSLIK